MGQNRKSLTITALDGNNKRIVNRIIKKHKEWYGQIDDLDLLHAHFYQVTDYIGTLVGFFALCWWHLPKEVVLALVYVSEKWRRQGVFTKMVEFAKEKTPPNYYLTINAEWGNDNANEVYQKMFVHFKADVEERLHWYVIKEPK